MSTVLLFGEGDTKGLRDMGNHLPLELITLLLSSGFSGILKIWSMNIEAKRQERLLTLQALNSQVQTIESARRHKSKGFQWTRRIIALASVFSIIVLPKCTAVFFPDIPVFYGYSELSKSFLFLGNSLERIRWMELQGLVITPLDTHLLSAIVGLYFGGAIVTIR